MDSELTGILKGIKQKTGIDIDAYAETMKFSATTREFVDATLPTDTNFTDVYTDVVKRKTFFYFRFRNAKLIGSIDGCTETDKNYAFLIMSLLDSATDKDDNLSKGEQLKGIILGDFSRQQIQKYMRRYSVPETKCYALVCSASDGKTENVASFLSRYLTNEYDSVVLTDDMKLTIVKFVIGDEDFNPYALAINIVTSLKREANVELDIGVGGVATNLLDINNVYVQATNALRMSKIFASKSRVHSYKDYVLIKMLEDIPKFKLSEYLDLLISGNGRALFRDEDMLQTAEAFLENDLNVSETARELFMHRNTLIYRIDKIMRETNLDIKKFTDALTFKLIAILIKMIG